MVSARGLRGTKAGSLSPLLPPLHARSARLPVRQFPKPVFSISMCDVRCGVVAEIVISNFHIIEGEGIWDIPRLGHEAWSRTTTYNVAPITGLGPSSPAESYNLGLGNEQAVTR